MCGSSTAKRRRRQFKNGFRHLAKLGRPIYTIMSKEKSAAREARKIQRAQDMSRRKGMKNKK